MATLTDGTSQVKIVKTGIDAGVVSNWTIGLDPSQVTELSPWFRTSNDGFERRLGDLGSAIFSQPQLNVARFSWNTTAMSISLEYTLTGGVGSAVLSESLKIHNNAATGRLAIALFDYNDFDLELGSSFDTVEKLSGSNVHQFDGMYAAGASYALSPSALQVAGFPEILSALSNDVPDNLDPTLSAYGPGDATFGAQWNAIIDPGATLSIDMSKTLAVPEPGSIAALGLGLLLARRRKSTC